MDIVYAVVPIIICLHGKFGSLFSAKGGKPCAIESRYPADGGITFFSQKNSQYCCWQILCECVTRSELVCYGQYRAIQLFAIINLWQRFSTAIVNFAHTKLQRNKAMMVNLKLLKCSISSWIILMCDVVNKKKERKPKCPQKLFLMSASPLRDVVRFFVTFTSRVKKKSS